MVPHVAAAAAASIMAVHADKSQWLTDAEAAVRVKAGLHGGTVGSTDWVNQLIQRLVQLGTRSNFVNATVKVSNSAAH